MIGPAELATIIIGLVTLISTLVGGTIYLSGVAHKTQKAIDDLEALKKHTERDLHDAKARLNALEAHNVDVAVLANQMSTIIERVDRLSQDVQALTTALLRRNP